MKQLYFLILAAAVISIGCNKEWTEELYTQEVSFVKSGVVTVYAKYKNSGGLVPVKVPILLSGTTGNSEDIEVEIGIDKDTLTDLNFDRFRLRSDLYFTELPEANYAFKSMKTTIPSNSLQGHFDLDLKMEGMDMIDKYILPLKITNSSKRNVSSYRWFKKSLMQIIPFNDYSGSYSNAGLMWDRDISENGQTALSVASRTTWVVDENSVFFFAGITEEEAFNRAAYKVIATFNADSTVTLTAPNPDINFSQQRGTYTVSKRMDEVQPYLEKTYITMNIEYWYSDISNPAFPINYRFSGPLTLEKVRNIQIPEEDQQVQIQ